MEILTYQLYTLWTVWIIFQTWMFVLTTSYYVNIKLLLMDFEVFFPNHYISVALFEVFVVICILQVVRPIAVMHYVMCRNTVLHFLFLLILF